MARKEGYGTVTLAAAGSVVVSTTQATLNKIINIGASTPIVSVYDVSGTASIAGKVPVMTKTFAGSDNLEFNIPCNTGITVTTSAAGSLVCTWSKA